MLATAPTTAITVQGLTLLFGLVPGWPKGDSILPPGSFAGEQGPLPLSTDPDGPLEDTLGLGVPGTVLFTTVETVHHSGGIVPEGASPSNRFNSPG